MTDCDDPTSAPTPEEFLGDDESLVQDKVLVEDKGRVHDDEGLHPTGEGLSETPIHATYEAIALHNDLARQLDPFSALSCCMVGGLG